MPLIEDRIDALAMSRIFSVLDLKNGYFHIPVTVESQKFTSFVSHEVQYEFLKTLFDLCNSSPNFLRFIDEVFRYLSRRGIVFTCMDDLIVPGKDDQEAFENPWETLNVAVGKELSINWKKCKFLGKQVEYLGYIIENGHVRPSVEKLMAVEKFPKLRCRKNIQSFLGLTEYFRKFIRDYAIIARPLSDVLKGNQKLYFGPEQERSKKDLKKALTTKPVLRIYGPDAITELYTDASKIGYGAVLLQRNTVDEDIHPVYYTSRKTSGAEKKLHSYEFEVLAIVNAIKKYRVYLQGLKFNLVIDCEAFEKTLLQLRQVEGVIQYFFIRLTGYSS